MQQESAASKLTADEQRPQMTDTAPPTAETTAAGLLAPRSRRQVTWTVAGSNPTRAPLPGECKVMVISVLITARWRDRSRPSQIAEAFFAAASGATTFSCAASLSSLVSQPRYVQAGEEVPVR